MNARGLLAVLCLLTAPTSGFATVVFQNTGTTSGWDYLSTQNKGTLTQVTSPAYKGSTAVRARQIYVSGASECFHSELGSDTSGQLQYWVDGSKKLERLNMAKHRRHDQGRVASSHDEADPSKW
jgi:hypothetical protein